MQRRTIVLKFGSSVLRTAADLPDATHEIYRWYRKGWQVVAVVSALNRTTETLLAEAKELSAHAEPHAVAELLATGERRSAALLGIALDRAGVPARVLDPREVGFTTKGTPIDAAPAGIDAQTFNALLQKHGVVVFPGFFGYDEHGRLQLLGRGGSDLSAVYLADAVDADRCCLLKDVDGVYDRDPAASGPTPARRFATLGYEQALECAQQLIQPKAVRLLQAHERKASVAALGRAYQSIVGPFDSTLIEARPLSPLRVLILGLGTVGAGVYEQLARMPEHFEVVGALVRDRRRHAARGIPESMLFDSQDALADKQVDIVVDVLPGLEPSRALARYFLTHGVHVVSANKMLIADHGSQLQALAAPSGAQLRYSAAVGGGTPMIETVQAESQHGPITELAGILNGTSNFILTRCSEGIPLEEALRAAQAEGFAEAESDEDISGRDAARKLRILSQVAFGRDPDELHVEGIDAELLAAKRVGLSPTQTLRQMARITSSDARIIGRVQIEAVDQDSVFGHTRDEWNCLYIARGDVTTTVRGRGAGQWPTAESVIADLMEVARKRWADGAQLS